MSATDAAAQRILDEDSAAVWAAWVRWSGRSAANYHAERARITERTTAAFHALYAGATPTPKEPTP